MRIIHGVIYLLLIILLIGYWKFGKNHGKSYAIFFQNIKKYWYLWIFLLIINSISLVLNIQKNPNSIYIKKDLYSRENKKIKLELKDEKETEEMVLEVRPKKLTQKACIEKMNKAFQFLDKNMKANNKSLNEVREDLDFSLDYEKYPFDVEVEPEKIQIIDENGKLENEKEYLRTLGYSETQIEQGIEIKIKVTLWYEEISKQKNYKIMLFSKLEKDNFAKVKKIIKEKEKNALYENGFSLPRKKDGIEIIVKEKPEGIGILVLGIISIIFIVAREKESIKEKEEERKRKLVQCYPWFVNEIVLYLGAGMQVKNIFSLLIEEYKKEEMDNNSICKKGKKRLLKDDRSVLIDELVQASHSMELGIAEDQVYYQLGRRLKLPCYIKIMTMLEQNYKRGTKGISENIEQEELNALEERKNLAKRLGEEAGTKLLGPMILMLIIVMLMIMFPAFLSFYKM